MRRIFPVVLLVFMCAAVAFCQQAPAASGKAVPAQSTAVVADNLFAELGAGIIKPHDEAKSVLGFGAVNYGFPLIPDLGLGGQIGTKLTARERDPDWMLSAGFFQRGLDIGGVRGAWAVQGMYERTWQQADLFGLKPVLGVELDKTNYLALTGVWGLNDRRVDHDTQQLSTQAMLLWGRAWDDKLTTEIGAGYQFEDIKKVELGAHAGYMLTNIVSLNGTVAFNPDGEAYAAISLGFDLGANGRNATLNNISAGANDFTPFPMGSLPVAFYGTEERAVPAVGGGDGGGGF